MKKQPIIVLTLLMLLTFCSCKAAEDTQEQELWLQVGQIGYDAYGMKDHEIRFSYNEDGYILSEESDFFYGGEFMDESNFTYDYTGEETADGARVCMQIFDRGDAPLLDPSEGEPIRVEMQRDMKVGWKSVGDLCTWSLRADELEDGKILRNWNEDPYSQPQFQYAEYTFDDHGNPVHIVSYGEDLSVLGTVDLTWQLLEYVE